MLASWRTISAQMTRPWGDQGDGTYRNPVIAADYSDPDPLRVGDDYYMAVSTFESYPGVTILHSKDLVNWTTIGAALTELADVDSAFTFRRMNRYNGGTYAPTITFHNGLFYVYVRRISRGHGPASRRPMEKPVPERQVRTPLARAPLDRSLPFLGRQRESLPDEQSTGQEILVQLHIPDVGRRDHPARCRLGPHGPERHPIPIPEWRNAGVALSLQ